MTLRDKIAEIVVNKMKTSPYFAERTADAILALPEIVNLQNSLSISSDTLHVLTFQVRDLQKQMAEVEAERDKLRLQHGNLINDTVSMGMAKDEAEARAEAAEAIVEKLTNDPDYLTVYRKGFEDGKAKLAEVQTMSEAPETIWASRDGFWFRVGPEYARTVEYLRADLPADLVERVKGSE